MKKYAVGVNHAAAQVKLIAYESRSLWSNQNPNGLRYIDMLGNFFNMEYEDTAKKRCMLFIKQNYPDFFFMDGSTNMYR